MRGGKKTTKTMKKRWVRYTLPAGFTKREYPKDLSCRMIKKSMMDHKNQLYGCQTTYKQYKYSGGTRATAMQSLQLHLTGAARSWLNTLPNDSIGSWGELENQFARNFCSTYKRPASLEEVKSCVQRRDETLCSYIQRWSVIKKICRGHLR
jgi:hypothetical protein